MTILETIDNFPELVASLILNNWTLTPTPLISTYYDKKRVDHATQDTILVRSNNTGSPMEPRALGYERFDMSPRVTVEIKTALTPSGSPTGRDRVKALYNEVRRIVLVNRRGISGQPASGGRILVISEPRDLSQNYVNFYRFDCDVELRTYLAKIDS